MRFRRSHRLRKSAEFHAVRERGIRIPCRSFILGCLYGDPELVGRRLGVIASSRVGGAVFRNRAKRRLRELFRRHQERLPADSDTVLIARRSLSEESFAETEKSFLYACRRLERDRLKEASR